MIPIIACDWSGCFLRVCIWIILPESKYAYKSSVTAMD